MKYFDNCPTLDSAKAEYKKLAIKLHPDRSGYDSTADFQEMQNQFENYKPEEEKFKGEYTNWNAKEYAKIIEQLMQIKDIEIEICGSWIWLNGDTKPVKEQIKEIDTGETMRRGWSKSKSKWYFSPKDYKKKSSKELSIEEIRGLYGSKKVKPKKQLQLN